MRCTLCSWKNVLYAKFSDGRDYPPVHIDREAWTAEWEKHFGYTECSKCEYWYESEEDEDEGDRSAFCPGCGRAMTEEAWQELEKKVKGENNGKI